MKEKGKGQGSPGHGKQSFLALTIMTMVVVTIYIFSLCTYLYNIIEILWLTQIFANNHTNVVADMAIVDITVEQIFGDGLVWAGIVMMALLGQQKR